MVDKKRLDAKLLRMTQNEQLMTLEQAQEILNGCDRDELRDYAFGDTEVSWWQQGTFNTDHPVEVAYGYFGNSSVSVTFNDPTPPAKGETRKSLATFEDDAAHALSRCGQLVRADRNDVNGTVPGIIIS